MTGVLLAVPPADFVLHNSLFLVAHFHNVIIGARAVRCDGGLLLLVPQGVRVHAAPGLGVASFWCWFIGFYLAFMPLYAVGLLGATRRMQHYADLSWRPYMIVAEVGAVVILCGIVATIAQLVVSIRTGTAAGI